MKLPGKPDQPRRNPEGSVTNGTRSVFSYHSAGNRASAATSEPRIKKPTENRLVSRYNWRHIPSLFALSAVLVSVVYLSTISPNPRLILIGQNNGPDLLRDSKVYHQAAQKILSNSLADKSKLTIDSDGFSKEMQAQFPELLDVAITMPLMGRRPVVELVAAEPVLRLTAQNESYLLDSNGRVLIRAKDVAGVAGLPEVRDQADVKAEVGKAILPGDSVAFITTFVNQLKAQKITIGEMTLPAKASELQVKLKDKPYYIKANLQTNPLVAVGQLLATKQKLEAEHKVPGEYIDVRVEEKVFVK